MCKEGKNHDGDLRIASILRGKKISLMVDGKSVVAYEGETVHAALTAANIRRLKNSNNSKALESRGVFCGMGICYECLVTINHVSDQRACMTFVEDQMEIITNEL